jgi:hypothetical protein
MLVAAGHTVPFIWDGTLENLHRRRRITTRTDGPGTERGPLRRPERP